MLTARWEEPATRCWWRQKVMLLAHCTRVTLLRFLRHSPPISNKNWLTEAAVGMVWQRATVLGWFISKTHQRLPVLPVPDIWRTG